MSIWEFVRKTCNGDLFQERFDEMTEEERLVVLRDEFFRMMQNGY